MKFIHVGVGGFGQCWVKVLKENPDAEVVALVDVKDESLAKACEVGGYHKDICFKSLPEALKSVKADAVVSSTPPGIPQERRGDGAEGRAERDQRKAHERQFRLMQGDAEDGNRDQAYLRGLAELSLQRGDVDVGQCHQVRKTWGYWTVVTHDLPFAQQVASHGVFLESGRVKAIGEVSAMIKQAT